MADVCLTYLNSQTIQNLPPDLWKYMGKIPLLDYWGVHARKELTERTKLLALQLLRQYDHHASAKILQVNQRFRTYYNGWLTPSGFTGLHAIACSGIVETAKTLIELGGCDVNGRDSLGCTPLMWAARNNNSGVCEALLELGDADPSIRDMEGETALSTAIKGGHEDIVKLLERQDVIPDSPNNGGQIPLSVAARNGHEVTVSLFFGGDEVNPHPPHNDTA